MFEKWKEFRRLPRQSQPQILQVKVELEVGVGVGVAVGDGAAVKSQAAFYLCSGNYFENLSKIVCTGNKPQHTNKCNDAARGHLAVKLLYQSLAKQPEKGSNN